MTQQQTYNRKSDAFEVACQMDVTIKTNLKEVKNADTESVPGAVANTSSDLDDPQNNCVTGQRGNTDDAKMLAVHDSTCQRGMYKTYQEEDEDEAYTEKDAVPRTVTNDDPQNNGVQNQTGTKVVARRPTVPTAASEKG
jgi:hypothetical protein